MSHNSYHRFGETEIPEALDRHVRDPVENADKGKANKLNSLNLMETKIQKTMLMKERNRQ